jgi:hypothetical protein
MKDLTLELAEKGYLHLENIKSPFEFAQEFGKLQPQYGGKMVWDVKADPKFDDLYHSLNTKKLFPHTECYEFQGRPPRYLVLWCIEPGKDEEGGETTLFDMANHISLNYPEDFVESLKEKKFNFCSSSGVRKSNLGEVALNPFIETEGDHQIHRFSLNNVDLKEEKAVKDFCSDIHDKFEKSKIEIQWKKGGFLIWDNHRMLHSRNEYFDRDRTLQRVWLIEN